MASKIKILECYDCLTCHCFQNNFPREFMSWVIARGWTVFQMATMEKEELFQEIGNRLSVVQRIEFRWICEQLIIFHNGEDCAVTHQDYFGKWRKIKTGDEVFDIHTLKGGITRGDLAVFLEHPGGGIEERNIFMQNILDGVDRDRHRRLKYSELPNVERETALVIETRVENSLAGAIRLDQNYVSQVGAHASVATLGLSMDRMNDLGGLIAGSHYSVVILDGLCTVDPVNAEENVSLQVVGRWMDFLQERMVNFEQSAFIVLVPLPVINPIQFARDNGFLLPTNSFNSKFQVGNRLAKIMTCGDDVE